MRAALRDAFRRAGTFQPALGKFVHPCRLAEQLAQGVPVRRRRHPDIRVAVATREDAGGAEQIERSAAGADIHVAGHHLAEHVVNARGEHFLRRNVDETPLPRGLALVQRSEEHTSELQSLMRISYAVFCLKKKKTNT